MTNNITNGKIGNGDSTNFVYRKFRVQTSENVVHATAGEDRAPRRTRMFLSPVVSSTRTPENFLITRACAAQVNHTYDVWSGLLPLRIKTPLQP